MSQNEDEDVCVTQLYRSPGAVTDTAVGGVNRTGVIHEPYICA